MSAVLFGSISTLADTSELQRQAFNDAFAQHGLDWQWDRDEYVSMLGTSGGVQRIAAYAAGRGEDVDAAAVHATKSQLFQASMAGAAIAPRAGVVETIRDAKAAGMRVGLVTTTSTHNVDALLQALTPAVQASDFAVVVDAAQVEAGKPDPAAYAYALQSLHEVATGCVAIEDNVEGVGAAVAAGLSCVAFPNANTGGQDFDAAALRTDALVFQDMQHLLAS